MQINKNLLQIFLFLQKLNQWNSRVEISLRKKNGVITHVHQLKIQRSENFLMLEEKHKQNAERRIRKKGLCI